MVPVILYLASKTSSSIELTITYVPSGRDQKHTNLVLCSENSIQKYLSITKIEDIKSCETQRKNI